MTDQPTVLDRMLAAGINADRARAHLEAGRVQVDGETATDSDAPAPAGARIVIAGE